MKKIIAVLLAVSVVLSLVGTPVTTFAENQEFIIAESYNGQVTGAVPENGALVKGSPVIVNTNENNKAVELSGLASENSVYYTAVKLW